MENERDQLLFGRFSREDCGLPPIPPAGGGPRTALRTALRAALLLALLVGAGWIAGLVSARLREMRVAELPARVRMAAPEDVPGILAAGKLYAAALRHRPALRRDLAYALLIAAENSPRRMGFHGNAAGLLAGPAPADNPAAAFAAELTASGIHAELGDHDKAFAAIARAENALSRFADENLARSHRLLLVNAQAYSLATAPVGSGRNPERALHLAQLLVTSRDPLPDGSAASESSAFLDTLASAWAAAGDYARALETQTYALGLAESPGLDVYIRHFDEFRRGMDHGE